MTDAPLQSPVSRISATLAAARHETRLLLYAPLTVVFQLWFLLALTICIFFVAGFLSTDLAALDLQWTFLPWIALGMIPALAMRAFVNREGDRELELIRSMPLPVTSLALSKWLAGNAVLLPALAMTAPFVATLAYLGEPDWGVIIAGYLGAALFLSSIYAVALFCAAATNDPIAAYVLGFAGIAILVLLGMDLGSGALGDGFVANAFVSAARFSPDHWFDRMSDGRIELAAFGYFIALTASALFGAAAILRMRGRASRWSPKRIAVRSLSWCAGLIAVALVLSIAIRLPGAVDLTEEGHFTLHDETVRIAETMPAGAEIEFSYSADETAIPAKIRAFARRVGAMLDQIADRSNGQITLIERRVEPDSDMEYSALAAGIARVPMTSGDSFLLGAQFRSGEHENAISYFDHTAEDRIEYDIARTLHTLGRTKTPKVGILTPLLRSSQGDEPRQGLAILEWIKREYDVAVIPHFADALPSGLDALLVIDAPILKRSMLYSIDQEVMAGLGLIGILDPYPRFNPANALADPTPSEAIDDLSDLLAAYGMAYSGSDILGDADHATPVQASDGSALDFPYWLGLRAQSLSDAHIVSDGLTFLRFAEAGSFELNRPEAIALVRSGPRSGFAPRDGYEDSSIIERIASFEPDGADGHTIAAAAHGTLQSAYPSAPDGIDGSTHRSETVEGNVFAIADADWLFDPMMFEGADRGGAALARPINDNAAFLLNMIEAATGDARLTGIRSRATRERSFTRIAAMLRAERAAHEDEGNSYATRIDAVESRIAQVLRETGAERVEQLPNDLQEQIRALREGLIPLRKSLREVRRKMREKVEQLEWQLIVFNLLAGPLLSVAFFALLRRRRFIPKG